MKRFLLTLSLCGVVSTASLSWAQTPVGPGVGGGPRPYTTSPYLNLARPGNAGVNYYQLVRPEFQTRQAIRNFQQEFNAINAATPAPADVNDIPVTGRGARFNSLSHFFPLDQRRGGGLGVGRGSVATTPLPAAAQAGGVGVGVVAGGRRR